MSGSAPIKVIRVRIVALGFGVCAVTKDVSPSAPDIVPSGQSRPSSICKVLSPSKSAASPLGDARISLRRLGMSLALCPSQKSLDPLYALPRHRPVSLLTGIGVIPKVILESPGAESAFSSFAQVLHIDRLGLRSIPCASQSRCRALVPCIGWRYLSLESSPSKSFAFQTWIGHRSP